MSKKVTTPVNTNGTPAPKAAKKLKPIEDVLEAHDEEDGELGKIAAILLLWSKGYSRKDIVLAGFNRSTTYRQVGEYEKMKKAPVMNYFGHDMYEGRVQRVMKSKKMTRAQAVEHIMKMDIA